MDAPHCFFPLHIFRRLICSTNFLCLFYFTLHFIFIYVNIFIIQTVCSGQSPTALWASNVISIFSKEEPSMNNLKSYFPKIRTKEEILAEIRSSDNLSDMYGKWTKDRQEHFLAFCSGEKGINILTDGFIKEIFNPEYAPERMEDFLSLLLHQPVKIRSVLPNDSARIAGESYLIITDIVIELDDGSIANLEIQRLGYMFPGQRSACYSADLLLRQYKRVRGKRSKEEKRFSYKDIQNVYTIVLYEKSPSQFHAFPNDYLHHLEARSDTGIKINLLQKYIFIPLDIFQEILHNNGIRNRLEAWLAFLSSDEPGTILSLLEDYPFFQKLYEELYTLCQDTKKVMNMFSEELAILDRNTEQYMMDEMQTEIDRMKAERMQIQTERDRMLAEKDQMLAERDQMSAERSQMLAERNRMQAALDEKDRLIAELKRQLASQN